MDKSFSDVYNQAKQPEPPVIMFRSICWHYVQLYQMHMALVKKVQSHEASQIDKLNRLESLINKI